ncbi:MAG: hypothetical protein OHK0053_15390 [Microscillaceae bacterium]
MRPSLASKPEHPPTVPIKQKIRDLLLSKLKFATTSALASLVDYSLYLLLVSQAYVPTTAHRISAGCGMVLNFFLQKRFIFALKRRAYMAFAISVFFSLLGIEIGAQIIRGLNQFTFFAEHQPITKLVSMGLVFFYNFYTKRFAFERRMW